MSFFFFLLNNRVFKFRNKNRLVFNFKSLSGFIISSSLNRKVRINSFLLKQNDFNFFIKLFLKKLKFFIFKLLISKKKALFLKFNNSGNKWLYTFKKIKSKVFKNKVRIKLFSLKYNGLKKKSFVFYLNEYYKLHFNVVGLKKSLSSRYYKQLNFIDSYLFLKKTTISLKNLFGFLKSDLNLFYNFLDYLYLNSYKTNFNSLLLNRGRISFNSISFEAIFIFITNSVDFIKFSSVVDLISNKNLSINYLKFLFNKLFFLFCVDNVGKIDILKFNFLNNIFCIDFNNLIFKTDKTSIYNSYILFLYNTKLDSTIVKKKKFLNTDITLSNTKYKTNTFTFKLLNEFKTIKKVNVLTGIKDISFVYKSRIINLFATVLLKQGKKYKFENIILNVISSLYVSSFGKNPLVILLKIFSILLNVFNIKVTTIGNRDRYKIKLYNTEEQYKNIIRKILDLSKDSSLVIENKDFFLNKIFYSENSLLFRNKLNKRVLNFEQRILLALMYILLNSTIIFKEYKEINKKAYQNLNFKIFSIINETTLNKKFFSSAKNSFLKKNFSVEKFLYNNLNKIYLNKVGLLQKP